MSTAEVLAPTSPVASPDLPSNTNRGHNLRIQPITNVDQDGAFIQDRVIKSGWLQKRTRKTKGWKRRWFVLRGDRLSCYKDQKEYKIHRQIYLSDITAVATLKDAKRPNVFGLFSPSKNYYFRAGSLEETDDWVQKIRGAAAVEDAEQEFHQLSPTTATGPPVSPIDARVGSSSSEIAPNHSAFGTIGSRSFTAGRMSTQTLEYSGAELGSMSSLSDAARLSQLSLTHQDPGTLSGPETTEARASSEPPRQKVVRNNSGLSSHDHLPRVIWHGYLYCLKSKGGMKQWKKYWIVVKNVNVAFYKNEEEYRAIRILPLESIVDAVEIDPLSKTKTHCMQIITEGKVYRFSARDEDTLARALGAMKSTLAKNKQQATEAQARAHAQMGKNPAN